MAKVEICLPPLLDRASEDKLVEFGMRRGDYNNKFEYEGVSAPMLFASDALSDLHYFAEDNDLTLPNKLIVNITEDR